MNRSLFRYYGGKFYVSAWIVQQLPPHERYIEPFCGAGSVFFRKIPCSCGELLNDRNGNVVNLYRVLQNEKQAELLIRKLKITPFARDEYLLALESAVEDPVERARRWLVRQSMSYYPCECKITASGFRRSIGYGRRHSSSKDWINYPEALRFFIKRLQGVVIENANAFSLMEAIEFSKDPDLLWYLDPPYPIDTRKDANRWGYVDELDDFQHMDMVDRIQTLKGMVVLSGYKTDIYRPLEKGGWSKIERTFRQNYKAKEKTECLWINPVAMKAIDQKRKTERVAK